MAANKRQAQLLARTFDGATVDIGGEDRDGIVSFTIRGPEGSWRLKGAWAGEGWPADVTRVLDRYPAGSLPRDLVVTARAVSPGARDLLNAHRANWADEQGNARIRGEGLLIMRDAPPERAAKGEFSWSPSALAIAEALLAGSWQEGVSTGDLARKVGWSPPQVSQVLQAFDENGWTVKYGPQRGPTARRELGDPEDLLRAWSRHAARQERDVRLTHRALRAPLNFLFDELSGALNEEVRWAAGGWAAAHELAPISTSVPSLQIYVHEDDFGAQLDRAIQAAGLIDVAEKGRVAFISAEPSVLSLAEQRSGLPLVSWPRIYADLISFGGRGLDAAEHLKEEVVGELHPAHEAPPRGLVDWERTCRDRLSELVRTQLHSDPYVVGTWSASYRLIGTTERPGLRELTGILREAAGRETGWPAWWAPAGGSSKPRPVDGVLECWMREMLPPASEGDFWRVDPHGRLCLIRGYQEDSEMGLEPGTVLDLSLPIWRTAECLLHADRLAHRLGASTIQLMMHWTGLRGRVLGNPAGPAHPARRVRQRYEAQRDEVVTYLHVEPDQVGEDLPRLTRRLVDPLLETFDLFEPPEGLYEEELERMRSERR